MVNVYYVADFSKDDYLGGAEIVDHTIYSSLKIPFRYSRDLNYNKDDFYIISNCLQLPTKVREKLLANSNYVIVEHDYKIHYTRQPNLFPNEIFPKYELINLDLYDRAQTVFMQSKDHLDCHIANGVRATFKVLDGSIWSKKELDTLTLLSSPNKESYKYAIIDSSAPLKGTERSINFCQSNNFDYELLPKTSQEQFYRNLSKYSTLVYLPIVKESFCKVVVEARALQMNVITNKTYGAVKEPWFNLSGQSMIDFLTQASDKNLKEIKNSLK